MRSEPRRGRGALAPRPRPGPGGGPGGYTSSELLLVVALMGLLAALGAGPVRELLGRARLRTAAAELARRMIAARWMAVTRGASVGLRFEREGEGWRVATYSDGDGDGIRGADIAGGRDRPLGSIFRAGERRGGVRFGIPGDGRFPRVPPSRGVLEGGSDPIRFGRSDIASFSPLGDATPGTAYLTDPAGRLAAVVLFGATARVRVRFFDPALGTWR